MAKANSNNAGRESAAKHNPFICPTGIKGTVSRVSAGLGYLSYAAGCAHELGDEKMSHGLDLLMQSMGKALSFEAEE